ncbi:MAG TPA: ABC transporter ATP-binding protein [Candidatus Dormibacteraeota bacterium]|nr:ABC transporter ATP-binding protein [Candidatus Dormibacteraeota bacterium]
MAPAGAFLQLVDLSKSYMTPGGSGALAILDHVSLEVSKGESLAIVGPSGSGKSTLLQIIGTLDRPTTGQVLLDGRDLSALDSNQLAAVRNREIGFVFQAHYLLPQCTVLENVLVPTLAKVDGAQVRAETNGSAKPGESRAARAMRLLERVGLAPRAAHRPGELSGGERQRAALVRALINAPHLLLADEPTGSLDHASAQELGQLLVELNREEHVTLIVVTHARELASKMGQVLALKNGKLAETAA